MGVWDRLISGQAGPRTHVGRVGAAGLVGAAKSSPLGPGASCLRVITTSTRPSTRHDIGRNRDGRE